jgi:SAM-dependent methyltransferase
MDDATAACLAVVDRCLAGAISAEIAIMEMLLETEDAARVEELLGSLHAHAVSDRVAQLRQLFAANRAGCDRIAAFLRSRTPEAEEPGSIEDGLARTRRLFDRIIGHGEELSVAFYSLGNPEILANATREILDFLDRRALLTPASRVLEVGCGIGRIVEALAPRVREVAGIDLSPEMVAAARRRTAGLINARIAACSGRDLSGFDAASMDRVLAIDSFPYIVEAGLALADALFAAVRRVLLPDGRFILLNFSYRDDLEADRRDLAALAARHCFAVELDGESPFRLWNGVAFVLGRLA